MRTLAAVLFVGALLAVASFTTAQPPGGGKGGPGGKGGKGGPGGGKAASVEDMVAKLMAFDKNNDGKLTKDEVTDERLKPLFDRADANKKGVLTKEELTAFFTKEMANLGGGPGGFGGGPGGPGGGRPGGPGGFGGGFGPPAPGQIMPVFLQDQLKLTDAQKKELDAMQKDVDAKLEKLLTDDQKKVLKEMKERRGPGGPGGPGGGFPGGPGGFPGGPGGNPPPPPFPSQE